jgi:HD-GYP domain-containing protein (c-di-GMP phosphodiesterase class II)
MEPSHPEGTGHAAVPVEENVCIQAVAHRSWESALETLGRYEFGPLTYTEHLLTLFRAGYHLRHIESLDDFLKSSLGDIVAVLGAQRGSIILGDEYTGRLQEPAVCVVRPGGSRLHTHSRTLAERAFSRCESLLCQDTAATAELQESPSVKLKSMASIICAVLRTPRKRLGVLHLDRGPLEQPFSEDDFFLADAIAASMSAGIESAQLVADQRDLFLRTVNTLARAVELRDQYTGTHTQRVTDYALFLAEELGFSTAARQQIRIGAPLHDIGKIGISDAILQKPAKLTEAEFETMKTHPVHGAAMLQDIPGLVPLIPIIRHHHERWDGTGYPDRLCGENISPLARVVAVADAFDAMTSARPYRPAFSFDQAFQEIADNAGTHFAPECVQAFLRLRPKIMAQAR